MSRRVFIYSNFILTLVVVLICCISQPANGRPEDPEKISSSIPKSISTIKDKDVVQQLESSTDLTTEKSTSKINVTETSTITTTIPTTTSATTTTATTTTTTTTRRTTKAPKVTTQRPTTTKSTTSTTTIGTTRTTTPTTSKPKSSTTQGTTKPTESPKFIAPLTKVPLKAEKPATKDVLVNNTEEEPAHKENENVKNFLPGRPGEVIPGVGDFPDGQEEEDPTFRLKDPGFGTPKPRPPVTTPAISDEDKRIRQQWGGNCLAEHWEHCNNITTWGGNYIKPDKTDPEKLRTIIVYKRPLNCYAREEKSYCLRNGWTVKRCHIICMAQCNRDMFLAWEKYVSHEGDCPLWK